MTNITDNNWTLHHTIGRVLTAAVKPGDLVLMPNEGGDLLVLGGRAPQRVNDSGSVIVHDPATEDVDAFEVPPRALGMVWISGAGGWSELPPTDKAPTRYSAEDVQQQIARDRRRHRISKKEECQIHALLKGRGD